MVAVSSGLALGGYLQHLLHAHDNTVQRESAVKLEQLATAATLFQECAAKPARTDCSAEGRALLTQADAIEASVFSIALDSTFSVRLHKDMLLIYKRDCSPSLVTDKLFAWSAWEAGTEKAFAQYHSFRDEGRFFDTSCVIATKLPLKNVGRLSLSLVNREKSRSFWLVSDARPRPARM